jgi:DNA-binding NtrC family response regulator
MSEDTASQTWGVRHVARPDAVPGLVLVFSGEKPHLAARALHAEPLLLGRDDVLGLTLDDSCLSRRHAQVSLDGSRFRIRDLDSRNGTFVDGHRLRGELESANAVLRIGDTVLLLCADIRPYEHGTIARDDGVIVGPSLLPVWQAIAKAAKEGDCLHVRGEAGAGKELAARHFHRASGREGRPFAAVNCATIPSSLADRVVFGARKGPYSDADSDGYVQAAEGGTLFLDEVADLDLAIQAKLFRTLEERKVFAVGATMPSAVDLRVCSATSSDLEGEVRRGAFREDLYRRIGRPVVTVPPLRERREEVPWLLQAIVGRTPTQPRLHASLVEAVILRPWPGNVRELEKRIGAAARAAAAQGERHLRALHLSPSAGMLTEGGASATSAPPSPHDGTRADAPMTRERIERALEETGGNVTAAAIALGLHRTQLRRLLARMKISRTESAGR